jgi:hypothetical protein
MLAATGPYCLLILSYQTMKKLLSGFALLLALTAAAPISTTITPPAVASAAAESAVYVCMSKGSVAYHSSDRCAGLNRCTHTVKAMSVGDAQELGKRACQKCY